MSALQSSQSRPNVSLFTSGLAEEADEASLIKHLEKLDSALKIKIVLLRRDPLTAQSRCCATMEFITHEDGKENIVNHNK